VGREGRGGGGGGGGGGAGKQVCVYEKNAESTRGSKKSRKKEITAQGYWGGDG